MTPRSVIFALDSSMTVEEVFERYRPIRFSRIPIYEGSLDNIIGMTMRYKIHEQLSSDQHSTQLKELLTTITSLPERMTVAQSVDFFIKNKEHVALAVDEYGVVTGLVSLEDAIETLLGVEIVDELDHVTDMRQFALDQWQQRKAQFRKS
jgi:CBS domain containing-hemolysin-like protein